MIVKIDRGFSVAHTFEKKVVKLFNSLEWTLWLATIRNCSPSTIKSYARMMDEFWVWTLYNDVKENETFAFYLARFREALLSGYKIKETVYDDYLKMDVIITVINKKAKSKQTINNALIGISSYMYYIDESDLVENKNFIDTLYEHKKSKKGPLGALDIKMSKSYLETFGKKQGIIKPYRVPIKSSKTIKAFPYKSFKALLEIAEPREKLLYLLMGACSARIGQAINLTLYDIDYEKEDIWLLDPTLDYQDIYGNYRKQWLLNRYGIDIQRDKEHNDLTIQFKYPIPLKHEPLYWINDSFKRIFFESISKYTNNKNYIKENLRDKVHPFFFVSNTGRRLKPRGIFTKFKKHIEILNEQGHHIPTNIGLHSLRHMFGVAMAEVFAETGQEVVFSLTKEAMGHSNIDSTMIYFNLTEKSKRRLIKAAGEKIFANTKDAL
ncbi:tyrosine-type recombinase/integrase [Sulfurimonas sp.]|uniref:tyrosine-type recombinase/integrase n=1 Tax=Sulfurimonas sp. TaxID=2022749 RepID=UPI0025E72CAF|nr:tyrosine-type recombinase/integrase [Sulfurimonas sp.]